MLNSAITWVVAFILGVVAISIMVSAGPQLVGDMLTNVDDSYISNTTGCYIDQPTGTSDTEVDAFYCTGFDLLPLVIIGLFFAIIVSYVIGVFTGKLKMPKF